MEFCKKQLKNKAIKRSLVAAENIPILEDILDKNIQQYKKLKNLKKNCPQFTRKIRLGRLDKLAHEVYAEVDNFLDFKSRRMPNILYRRQDGFFYVDDNNLITVETLQRLSLIPGIAHEYSHYVHYRKGLGDLCYDIFTEGHARGVERQISEIYKEKEDNELFLYDISEETVNELKYTYTLVCRRLKQKPKSSLLKDSIFISNPNLIEEQEYSLGNAFFLIHETRYGKDIYKDVLNCK